MQVGEGEVLRRRVQGQEVRGEGAADEAGSAGYEGAGHCAWWMGVGEGRGRGWERSDSR